MARELRFAIPGDLATLTGGYVYDRRLSEELRRLGWRVDILSLAASFPAPREADLAQAAASLAGLADGSLVLLDGLAFGALPALAEAEVLRLRLVALVHHPLALEPELPPARRAALRESERRALAAARAVIVTSETTAASLIRDYGVARDRLLVARPGTDAAPPARGSAQVGTAPHLLSIGSLVPRKGHDVLIAALTEVADLSWTCAIAGSPARAPETAATLTAAIAKAGLGKRVALLGESVDVARLYDRADLFVLASRHEGFGMVFAEALQRGLPIVGTTAGAIPEVVPPEAGILVPPDDARALAEALRRLLSDPSSRLRLAEGARRAAERLTRWPETGGRVAAFLDAL